MFENFGMTPRGRKALIRMRVIAFVAELMRERRTRKGHHVQHVLQGSVGICAYCCTEKEGCLQVLEGDVLMTIFNSMKVREGQRNARKSTSGWEQMGALKASELDGSSMGA